MLLITDRKQAKGSVTSIAQAAFAAGCRWISVREKDLSASEQVALMGQIKALAEPWGAKVTLHGNASDAVGAKADGVHLPAGSDTAAARRLLGHDALLGLSIHTVGEARGVDPDVVDYVIAGPIFETMSKPGYAALGTEGVSAIAAASRVPVIAIGGVDRNRAPVILSKGPAGLAIMGGVMRAHDPATEIHAILAAFPPKK